MAERLTIDELARAAGQTSRNIRAYQERGLLPPPAKVGRTGYYDASHVARLKVIADLLERGYSLAAIGDLLDVWHRGGDVGKVLGLEQALVRPFTDEQPTYISFQQLAELFGDVGDSDIARRALELGLAEIDGMRVKVPSMRVLEAGVELVQAGVPYDAVLDQAEELQHDVRRIAQRFVAVVTEHVLEPLLADGPPDVEQLEVIADLIERLRPLAAQIVFPMLAQALEREVAETAHRIVERTTKPAHNAAS
ncbi:MAG: hypothetical protein QOE63_1549 [Acidimicrobiaceae bacterium]